MPEPSASEPSPRDTPPRPTVVGIGTSAGGLAALRTFFEHIPEDTGAAFVVVVHLNPSHESHLCDLLQSHARMPVLQVTGTTDLLPDHVYVIPPGANLSLVESQLRLSELENRRSARAPVDHFFRTLAAAVDGHTVGVILTGTGSDGALGIKAIKECNGFTFAQDPTEAEYDGMPRSAISTGLVDEVLPLAQIPAALLRVIRTSPKVTVHGNVEVDRDEQRLLHRICTTLNTRTGRDFSRYRQTTLLRRIARRMHLHGVETLGEYHAVLSQDDGEVAALADDILITVTNFFRDPGMWSELAETVIPQLFAGKTSLDSVRAWSVGCATGEEAYSVAILLLEQAARRENAPAIQVFGSDLHDASIERARAGFYLGDIDVDVSAERLTRFFQPEDGGYRVRSEVRERVVFAPHNVLGDPPFSRLDLILCRNVLIYLQRDVQRDVIRLLHYALNPEGVLVLGSSESVEESALFRAENRKHAIYLKRNIPTSEPPLRALPLSLHVTRAPNQNIANGGAAPGFAALHQQLVAEQALPSLLVDPEGRIVHLTERAGRYLIVPAGAPTSTAHDLVRDELRLDLRLALHAARTTGTRTRSQPISVRIEGSERVVILDVRPAGGTEQDAFVLVFFDERDPGDPGALDSDASASAAHILAIEDELDGTKHRLQDIIQQYEGSQVEMRAAHQELMSANEELRSTLEELETSKEELQSMNEELLTVNQENRQRVEELAQLSSDLQNLLAATEIATLFLDRELRILRFTPKVGELFNMRPMDRGRPLSDLTHHLGYPQIRADAESVLRSLVPLEREVRDASGHWYLTRVLPYRSTEDRIEGVVITFVEISARRDAEEALRQLNETLEQRVEERTRQLREQQQRLTALIETAALTVWSTDAAGRVVEDSASWRMFTGQTKGEWLGEGWVTAVHPAERAFAITAWHRSVETGTPLNAEYRLRHAPTGSWRWTNARAAPLRDESGTITGWIGMNVDVHEKRAADEARRDVMRQLVTAEEDERRRISRELHDQMSQQLTGLVLDLRQLQKSATTDEMQRQLQQMELRTSAISRDVQNLALRLRPPALDNLGLKLAIESLLEEWTERHGLTYDLQSTGLDDARLSPDVEVAIYRAVQESLTNILRHAGATHVSVVLERRADIVRAIIEDDGSGFDVERVLGSPEKARRLGLRGMRERIALLGGSVDVESTPGDGTTIFVRLPQPPATSEPGAPHDQHRARHTRR